MYCCVCKIRNTRVWVILLLAWRRNVFFFNLKFHWWSVGVPLPHPYLNSFLLQEFIRNARFSSIVKTCKWRPFQRISQFVASKSSQQLMQKIKLLLLRETFTAITLSCYQQRVSSARWRIPEAWRGVRDARLWNWHRHSTARSRVTEQWKVPQNGKSPLVWRQNGN